MTREPQGQPPREPSSRVEAAVGVLLILAAIAIVVVADPGTGVGALVAALVLAGLGLDAVHAAARGRRSLLSRIGPLP